MLSPAVIGVSIPIIVCMIPIVAILTRHQQRMAEIIHGSSYTELDSIKAELRDLRALVNQQNQAIHSLTARSGSQGDSRDSSVRS